MDNHSARAWARQFMPWAKRAMAAAGALLAACSSAANTGAGAGGTDAAGNGDIALLVDAATLDAATLDAATASETGSGDVSGGPDGASGDAVAADVPADAPVGDDGLLTDAGAATDANAAEVSASDGAVEAASDGTVAPADAAKDTGGDVGKDLNTEPKGIPSATITAPKPGAVVESGKPVQLAGIATDTVWAAGKLSVEWSSSVDGFLGLSTPNAAGAVTLDLPKLSAGKHTIYLTVTEPSGLQAIDSVEIGVCSWGQPDTFDTAVAGTKWKKYGDASFDPGGWLEMTGNAQSKKGAIFNVVDFVSPGDVQISFKIATGGFLTSSGQLKGADGFALSVIDVKTVAQLEAIINAAGKGGCLGYGVAGDCHPDNQPSMAIEAFHIEIDTWQNKGDPNWDPTPQNHIGIMQNGDASNHYLFATVPSIEDLKWHLVTVEIKADVVRVTLDGAEIINKAIPNFKFRGGFIGFSGTTGWATNYHRFDDLQILQQCIVK